MHLVIHDASLRKVAFVDNTKQNTLKYIRYEWYRSLETAGSLTWDIPADSSGATGSLNDYIWWRQIFWLGATNQYVFVNNNFPSFFI